MRVINPRTLVLGVCVLLIAYFALVPVAYLLWRTLAEGSPAEVFRSAYSEVGLREMVLNSVVFSAGSSLVAMGVGTPLAYLVMRTNVYLKQLLVVASLLPLVIPGILHTVAWIFLTSPRIGLINVWSRHLIGHGVVNAFSMPGMVVVEGLHLAPLVFLLMCVAFRNLDPALEEAALMSGARVGSTFRRITLPALAPALYAGFFLVIIRSLEAFEVPALLGIPGGIWVFTSRIWRALGNYPRNLAQAGAYSISLLVLIAIGVIVYVQFSRRAAKYQTMTGRTRRSHPIDLGPWRGPMTGAIVVYLVIAVALPVLVLVYASTQPFYSSPSIAAFAHASLDNFRSILANGQMIRAVRNSLLLSVGSATVIIALAAPASWLVVKTRARGRWLVDAVASMPLVIPGLVMGVALLFVYLRVALPIYGTLWILLIAYVTRYLPYGMRYASASMYQVGSDLEEAAQVSGAGWGRTLQRVTLPLLAPGLIAGWLYIVIVSVRELAASILLFSPGKEVISVLIWEQWQDGRITQLAALSVMLMAVLLVLAILARRFGLSIIPEDR